MLKTEVFAYASRSKAKAKPRRPTSTCSSTRTALIGERIWTEIEPGTQSNLVYQVAQRLTTLRHGQSLREDDRAIEFWRSKENLRNAFLCDLNIGLMKCGRVQWQEAEETRKDFNIALIHQDKKFFISEPFKVTQDAISLILHYRTMY